MDALAIVLVLAALGYYAYRMSPGFAAIVNKSIEAVKDFTAWAASFRKG